MCKKYRELDAEFIGVNLGSIGFLNEILHEDLEKDLKQLVSGEYDIEIGIYNDVVSGIYFCTDAVRNGNFYKVGKITIE